MKTLTLWKSASEQGNLDQFFDNLFGQNLSPAYFGRGKLAQGKGNWSPAIDISETDDTFEITVEVAGIPEDQVKLTITDNVLAIKGKRAETTTSESTYLRQERRFGQFQRAISLPPHLLTDQARASFSNGLLSVVIPKAEAVKPKEIEIQVS